MSSVKTGIVSYPSVFLQGFVRVVAVQYVLKIGIGSEQSKLHVFHPYILLFWIAMAVTQNSQY